MTLKLKREPRVVENEANVEAAGLPRREWEPSLAEL